MFSIWNTMIRSTLNMMKRKNSSSKSSIFPTLFQPTTQNRGPGCSHPLPAPRQRRLFLPSKWNRPAFVEKFIPSFYVSICLCIHDSEETELDFPIQRIDYSSGEEHKIRSMSLLKFLEIGINKFSFVCLGLQ